MIKYDVAIIGGGISGLSALHYIKKEKPKASVHLFEADNRLGGTIGTDNVDGYSFDWGPNGFLDREPLTLQLCDELNLNDSLERAGDNVSNRYILRNGKLRNVPMSPPAFLKSDILSLRGKLRLFMEPFAKNREEGIDESVYDFVKRRIGIEAADYLVQPMVSGVYGGVAQKLSLQSCFPIMREMEDEYGSLFKAMIAKAKKAKKEKKKSGSPSGPGGWLTSFDGGLYKIIERLNELYTDYIDTSAKIKKISKENCYLIELEDGTKFEADNLIIAIPSNNVVPIVKDLSPKLSSILNEIPYAPISVVCLGYSADVIKSDLNGFGFLVPKKENLNILGSIWTSSIFKKRVPESGVQFRTMIGGDGDHESIKLSDEKLQELAIADLSKILNIEGNPDVVKIYKWKHGIPQFIIGHNDRLQNIETELDKLQNIYLTGNAYYGIGLNDCIKQSHKVVNNLIKNL